MKTRSVAGIRSRPIPFSQVCCDGNEWTYLREVLESGWLTTAGKTQAFEEEFARAVQARFALAVNSCTAALQLGLEALGVGPGDRVLVPTMTFAASAMVVCHLGAEPVLLDVDYGTNLVTPAILERALARHANVKAMVVVHYGGQPARLTTPEGTGLVDVCRQRGIKILEDAAHAFPARYASRMIGSIGDATCFSFYANKTITTGEGGMLTTNSEAMARRVKVMRLHGIDRDAWDRFTSKKPRWEYDIVAPGYKYNMADLNAAIGLAQLERAWAMRAERQRCADHYRHRLHRLPGVDLPVLAVPPEDHAWHLFPITLNPDAKVSRDRLIELLSERGVGTSVHYRPLHRMTYFRTRYHFRPADFPEAERTWKGCVSLPIYPTLTDEALDYVCDCLWEILS